ncbi:hypothetical protein HZS_5291 [Henneguya salminicola]|nr:hypothetical protein HZS_5291 [Henneguya salminicola]
MYALVEIYQIDINMYQRDFYIKLHSLYWNNYKLYDGQCCSINSLEPCVMSCDYSLEFFISGKEIVIYDTFRGTKIKENRLLLYAVTTHDAPAKKYFISIELRDTQANQIIDIGDIDADEYSTVNASRGINIKGKYVNVNFTVSFGQYFFYLQ